MLQATRDTFARQRLANLAHMCQGVAATGLSARNLYREVQPYISYCLTILRKKLKGGKSRAFAAARPL
jgi:hypothetical protein